LYRNATSKPGLRIKLEGASPNLDAIGASIRLVGKNGSGPVRELYAGSGYWSQDSLIQVMTLPEAVQEVWVRWPGGKRREPRCRIKLAR